MEVKKINFLREAPNLVEVTLSCGFFANIVFSFTGTSHIKYSNIEQVPKEGRTIMQMEKLQISNLRKRKYQNKDCITRAANIRGRHHTRMT